MFGWLFRESRVDRLNMRHWQLRRAVDDLARKVTAIMATQAELTAAMNELGTKIDKIGTETAGLKAEIVRLGELIATAPVSAELQAAFDAVKLKAQAVDDAVEDAAPTPPSP